ncbi:MAG: hypothetical protein WAM97_11800 [Acidimicrobiales bacterium]
MGDAAVPRTMWHLLEPYHAITYFAPESIDAFKRVGLKGFWMGYFAGRAALLGEVGPNLVTATFHNFAPVMVNRAIPDAWTFAASIDEILKGRLLGMDHALTRILGDQRFSSEVQEAAEIAEDAVAQTGLAGRPMFAANADLATPDGPHLRLWQAATCLREHRGDGHVAMLVDAEFDGCQAHVSFAATGAVSRAVLQQNRGWTDEEWAAASDRLRDRGILGPDDTLTDSGKELRGAIEDSTDRLAREPWDGIGAKRTRRLAQLMGPITSKIASSGVIPGANPMGLPSK